VKRRGCGRRAPERRQALRGSARTCIAARARRKTAPAVDRSLGRRRTVYDAAGWALTARCPLAQPYPFPFSTAESTAKSGMPSGTRGVVVLRRRWTWEQQKDPWFCRGFRVLRRVPCPTRPIGQAREPTEAPGAGLSFGIGWRRHLEPGVAVVRSMSLGTGRTMQGRGIRKRPRFGVKCREREPTTVDRTNDLLDNRAIE